MRMAEIVRLDLARAIAAGLELGDARGVDVEGDDRCAVPAEGDGDRQPDIAETDDGKLSIVRHEHPFPMQMRLSLPCA